MRVAFHPRQERLAVGVGTWATATAKDYSIDIYDWQSENIRVRLSGPRSEIKSLTFDAKGELLAAGAGNGEVFVWDANSGNLKQRWFEGNGSVRSVQFLNEGRDVLTASASGRLAVHSVAGDAPSRLHELGEAVERVAVSPSEREIALGGTDGTLRFLSLPDMKEIAKLPRVHELAIRTIAYTPDGKLLATGGYDRQVIVWDVGKRERLFTLPQASSVFNLAFDADGLRLGICGAEELVTVWNLSVVRPELTALGLSWEMPPDEPSPTVVASSSLSELPLVRRVDAPLALVNTSNAGQPEIEQLLHAQEYRKALEVADAELKAGRESKQLQLARAHAFYNLEQFPKAISAASRHLELCPNCGPATALLADCYEAKGDYDRAVAILKRGIAADTDDVLLNSKLARIFVLGPDSMRRPQDALPLAQHAASLMADAPSAARILGLVYYRLERFAHAAETLRVALASRTGGDPEDRGLSQLILAMCMCRLGDRAEAQQLFDLAVADALVVKDGRQAHRDYELLRDEVAAVLELP